MKRSLCEINHKLETMELCFPSPPSDNQSFFSPLVQSATTTEEEMRQHQQDQSVPCPPPSDRAHSCVYWGEGTASAVQNVTPQGKDTPQPVPDS